MYVLIVAARIENDNHNGHDDNELSVWKPQLIFYDRAAATTTKQNQTRKKSTLKISSLTKSWTELPSTQHTCTSEQANERTNAQWKRQREGEMTEIKRQWIEKETERRIKYCSTLYDSVKCQRLNSKQRSRICECHYNFFCPFLHWLFILIMC